MKNISKLLLTLSLLVAATAAQAYNDAATQELKTLLDSEILLPTAMGGGRKWTLEDGVRIKTLIEQGANPNIKGRSASPLFAAIYSNNPEAVEAVVNAGGDVTELEPYYDSTPLKYSKTDFPALGVPQAGKRDPRIVEFLETVQETQQKAKL